jgi:hypothetical protein
LNGAPTTLTANGTAFTGGGINAGGCDGSGFGTNGFCFDLDPPVAVSSSALSFDIKVTGTTFNLSSTSLPDLKIDWANTTTDTDTPGAPDDADPKLGSLFSANIPVGVVVPEPATWAMMLIGVGAIGAAMRFSRRKAISLTAA